MTACKAYASDLDDVDDGLARQRSDRLVRPPDLGFLLAGHLDDAFADLKSAPSEP